MKSKSFVDYPLKFFLLAVSSLEMSFWTLLKPFFIESKEPRVMFWKGSYWCLAEQYYEQYLTLLYCIMILQIFSIRYLMYQCVFDTMQLDNMLQKCFNCSYHGSTSLQTRITVPSNHQAFTSSKSTIKILQLGVKDVQS